MRTYVIIIPGVSCLVGWWLTTSLWIYSQTPQNKNNSVKKNLFSKRKDDEIYLYEGYLQNYSWKKIIYDTQNTLRTHHFVEIGKLWKCLSVLLSIIIDEVNIENRKNQLVDDIINFNNKHIIRWYSVTQSNVPEEPR